MPDLPVAPRIPWNRPEIGGVLVATDGSGGNLAEATQQQKDNLAGENNNTWIPPLAARIGWVALVLPPFDLAGFFGIRASTASARTAQYSLNTTNGSDGTWTNIPGWSTQGIGAKPNYRTELLVLDPVIEDVVGVRFGTTDDWPAAAYSYRTLHVYGYLKGADRLEPWHPTLDQRLDGDHFDLGNIARGGAAVDVDFRVKNLSGTLTANSVSLERYVDTDSSSPTVESWHELAYDGGAFSGGPLAIGNLAPGAISDVCTLRRELPADASLGYWSGKLLAEPDSWS